MSEGMRLNKLFNFVNGHVEKIRSHLASVSGSLVKVANSTVAVQCNGSSLSEVSFFLSDYQVLHIVT